MHTLSQLPSISDKKAKRLGRGHGSGKGLKSTRGTTRHQKARGTIPLGFIGGQARDVKKYPLMRGKGKNKSVQAPVYALALSKLNAYDDGATVNFVSLVEKKLIDPSVGRVKVVANGKLEKKLTVSLPVSAQTRKAIETAGGSVV
ncbi:50S ribosomal protein L15 [Candidatus Microgenomates bacterium]|nr:50S ribosomal protein L15 [Candidatus Microgenomates bacterium]